MGILTRFKEIMSSNINAALDKLEDPSKMVDQYIRQISDDLGKVKAETAGIMAEEQRSLRRMDECRSDVERYQTLAERAVAEGNDDDARAFLAKKNELTGALAGFEATYEAAKNNAEKMREMHEKLQSQLSDLNSRRDAIKAKVAVAKTQERINKVGDSVSSVAGNVSAFERMEEKADRMLDTANAMSELSKTPSDDLVELEKKYNDKQKDVDDELAALKAKYNR